MNLRSSRFGLVPTLVLTAVLALPGLAVAGEASPQTTAIAMGAVRFVEPGS